MDVNCLDIIEIASITLKKVLKYCFDLLSLEYSPSLPADLRLEETEEDALSSSNDCYCTVLFNDETHTFDQLRITLTRVLKCPQRNAIEFVANIDQEGRFAPGIEEVTPDDCLKKEIIQQLCTKSLSHSELNKTLQDYVHHELGMERVIKDIADFKKPAGSSSSGKGVLELKSELYCNYNIFFYHYTKEELSKSEEAQRKKRKTAGELECCPPPRLPKLTEMFYSLINLLQCDVMLSPMSSVLFRTLNLKARSFSEPQVQKVLHLIGYALQEQESG